MDESQKQSLITQLTGRKITGVAYVDDHIPTYWVFDLDGGPQVEGGCEVSVRFMGDIFREMHGQTPYLNIVGITLQADPAMEALQQAMRRNLRGEEIEALKE